MEYYKDINNIVNDMLTIGNETEKREKELMEEEKRYYTDIKITWEEVPDEDLWEDREINNQKELMDKIEHNLLITGKWKLIRRKE